MNEATMKFPMVWAEGDYHELSNVQRILSSALAENVEYVEVGFDGMYWAVFFIGEEPTELIEQKTKQLEGK